MELNSSQQKAVNHKEGPCLVLAGPGSGKTAVLTRRVNALIQSGTPAEEILVITFTKAAAIEMKERFDRLSDGVHPVTFGTFHSLFWGILQKELGYKNSDIVIGGARDRILKESMIRAGLNQGDGILMKALISELSMVNNSPCELANYIPKFVDKKELLDFSNAYEYLKNKYHVIDFDDMLTKAYGLFTMKPEVLKKWQNRFSYFLIDEMQDMNDIQFALMKMLAERTNNVFCVGDDDQSIYGFRGANPSIMKEFAEGYEDITTIVLDYNYRNPGNLVSKAGSLIAKNTNRYPKDINSVNDDGGLYVTECDSDVEEAEYIVREISELHQTGNSYDSIAVLYRNHSDAKYLVDKLLEAKVPFYLKEQMPNIYSHFIISDMETYFQIALGNETRARILSVMNRPNRFLHRRSVEVGSNLKGMLRFYRDNPMGYRAVEALIADMKLISKMSPYSAVNYIKNVMGYGMFLKEEASKHNTTMEEYIEVLDFFCEIIRDCKTIKQAIDKLNILRLKIDYENKNKVVDKKGKVGLYTLHSSKGLEFEKVFILGVNDGVMPSNKAESREDVEAERRLFYVGITRTKRDLYLSYTNKKNRDRSRFLDEMMVDYSSSKSSP
ncbi:MAG: ATP-dependent helicase [Pseudobutyrivibrio sp.]|nr:ATP-dependent helicase [Pseudobutyrivibrio sp.]